VPVAVWRAELGQICGYFGKIFVVEEVFDPDDVHWNNGPQPAKHKTSKLQQS